MNTQEAFTRAAYHLLDQGVQSLGEDGDIAYRGVDGCKCPIGVLIPDELYDPRMEGSELDIILCWPGIGDLLDDVDETLLLDLQDCHNIWEPDNWHFRLTELSRAYNLDFE